MRSIKRNLILTLLSVLLSGEVFAQSKVSAGAMLLFGTGKMGNSTDVLDRSMVYTPIALFAGYNIKKFRLGINYEYNLAGQSEDPANLGNQNVGGKGTAMGLRFDFYDGKQSAGMVYHLSEKYTLDKPTILGTTADYDGKSGFSFQYYRRLRKKVGIVLDYTMVELKSSAGNTADIKFDRIGLGIVFTNFPGN